VSRPTVIDWRARYESSGLAGLDDAPRSGRPRTVDHESINTATLVPPRTKLGVMHWFSRLLGSGSRSAMHCRAGLERRPRPSLRLDQERDEILKKTNRQKTSETDH
jgi:hypothetical protein